MNLDSKIFVAGHRGLVGSAIIRKLIDLGYTNIVTATKSSLDLRDQSDVADWFASVKPEYVFLAAAKVGGIGFNKEFPADFIRDNLQIQTNVIDSAYRNGCKNLLFLGSVCIYPKFAPTPVKETSLLNGDLEPTNEAYAIAKIAGIKMCQAYSRQYGMKTVNVMPANLYGPNDFFHAERSHVIPAMFQKFMSNTQQVQFWGDGTARREFLYSDDLADACLFLMNSEVNNGELINVGQGDDVTILDLSQTIANIVGFNGSIVWDKTKPNGTPKRLLDSSIITSMGWSPKHNLISGLTKTYNWYSANGSLR